MRHRDAGGRTAGAVWLCLGVLALGCGKDAGNQHAPEPNPQQDARALYADDSLTRNAAAERMAARGQPMVPLLDPFQSGCIRSDSFPEYCRNFDRALGLTIGILGHISGSEGDSVNPAKNLLWHIVHAHTGDAFQDLTERPEWQRTDADALRKRATEELDRLMGMSPALREEEVGRRATASVLDPQHHWYLLSNCAGEAMYVGCNYGSYLFAPGGRPVSFRLIGWDQPDNFGAGVKLGLKFPAGVRGVGVVRAVGGFGGDRERLTFYRLDDPQVPLCLVERSATSHDLLRHYDRYVSVDARGCRVLRRDPGVRVRRLS